MPERPFKTNVDRREFLNGQWAIPTADQSNGSCEIASILVRAKPERLRAAARAIAALPATQIYDLDPKGRIIVVIEALDTGTIGTTLNTISLMPGVLSAALVFHGTDES